MIRKQKHKYRSLILYKYYHYHYCYNCHNNQRFNYQKKQNQPQQKHISKSFIITNYTMTQPSSFNCSTCAISFQTVYTYKEHYKSQFHKYNLNRKTLNLPSESHQNYLKQFDNLNHNPTIDDDYQCQICNKSFQSSKAYSHHLNSKKHKHERNNIINTQSNKLLKQSNQQPSQKFNIASKNTIQKCILCNDPKSEQHLQLHNFPPFKDNCKDFCGLLAFVQKIINGFYCLYCKSKFHSIQGVKQHMSELGHAKINTENFQQFQIFYDWSLNQQKMQQSSGNSIYFCTQKQKLTLKDLQFNITNNVIPTSSGAVINGKLVGLRAYKKYYSQYFRSMNGTKAIPRAFKNSALQSSII